MTIDGTVFTCEMEDVLTELQSQLIANGYPYLSKGFKRSNDSLQVQCPFHGGGQEKHPSYGIRRYDGIGHCFACGAIHSLPEFITACFEKNDITGRFGRQWLFRNFMSLEVEERQDVELDYFRPNITGRNYNNKQKVNEAQRNDEYSNKDKQVNVRKDGLYIGEAELDRYRYYHSYWKERGIIDDDIIELFDLGYDRETNSITFPVRDTAGNCLFIARRNVCTKFFNYPKGVQKPLYGLYELYHWGSYGVAMRVADVSRIIVCESMIDCILLWQAGHFALALNGLGNALQMKQLRELSCRSLVLATDNDDAGYKARQRIRQQVTNKLISEIIFPCGIKDIGECTTEQINNILKWEDL